MIYNWFTANIPVMRLLFIMWMYIKYIILVVLYDFGWADVYGTTRLNRNIWKCVLSGRLNRSTKAVPRGLWYARSWAGSFAGSVKLCIWYYSVSCKRGVLRVCSYTRRDYTIIKSRIAKTARSTFPNCSSKAK